MKKHYFEHDYSARNDQKILQLRFKHGAEGYGIFWMICETMAEDSTGFIQASDIGGLSLGYGVAIGRLSEVLECCVEIGLFKKCEHGNYYSDRMIKHKQALNNFYAQKSESGKKGAEKRWKNGTAIAQPLQNHSTSMANDSREDKSIVKKRKEKKEEKDSAPEQPGAMPSLQTQITTLYAKIHEEITGNKFLFVRTGQKNHQTAFKGLAGLNLALDEYEKAMRGMYAGDAFDQSNADPNYLLNRINKFFGSKNNSFSPQPLSSKPL